MAREFVFARDAERVCEEMYPTYIKALNFGNVKIIPTSHGSVVAFQNYAHEGDRENTVVPGFYLEDLPTRLETQRRVSVEVVPEVKQQDISEILRQHNYRGIINFWPTTQ